MIRKTSNATAYAFPEILQRFCEPSSQVTNITEDSQIILTKTILLRFTVNQASGFCAIMFQRFLRYSSKRHARDYGESYATGCIPHLIQIRAKWNADMLTLYVFPPPAGSISRRTWHSCWLATTGNAGIIEGTAEVGGATQGDGN